MADAFKENQPIDKILEHYDLIKDVPYGFENEQKQFKAIKRTYESMKKKFVGWMTKNPAKSDKKLSISRANAESREYDKLEFTFQEGVDFRKFITDCCDNFKKIFKDVLDFTSSRFPIRWKNILDIENKLKELPFDYEDEETIVWRRIKKLESSAIIQSYKDFVAHENKTIKSKEDSKSPEEQKKSGLNKLL